MIQTYAAKLKNLSKAFDSAKAVDDLSLDIEQGKITGVIGADGAGKTTLLRLITGLLLPDSGAIEVSTRKIGYMPQKFGLYDDLTVIQNLNLYADLKDVPHDFDKLLEFTNLGAFQNRLAGQLSGGMKQKLGLACALMGSPEFLVLDEPSVGVDPVSRRELMKLVRDFTAQDTTVIWSTAYLDEAHSFDTAVVMNEGKIIFNGKPQELGATSQEFENRIIELMGGYEEHESLIAKSYEKRSCCVEFPVEACDLVKKYGDFYAVKKNSFCIKEGEIFGLIGPNGAGKTTSFRMMCGLSAPTEGTARIMDVDIQENPSLARSHLGYMAQKFSLYGNLTVRQNLEFFAGVYGLGNHEQKARIDEIIQVFGFGKHIDQKSGELPLGFKQRLSMACALIHNPAVLFLDEPTSGVDVLTRREFWNHIRSLAKKGVTILITTHFMDEAEFCDRISLFYDGEAIAVGTPQELKTSAGAATMEDAFIKLIEGSQ